ncbi:MAG TPA: 4-hydroxythreonine-4-phosphate dehydrogenase PdxA, partial [Candidatus Binataceae bacterium]|nr:4-hydroxythreonine-4-phosphate dehydrogenase PdxA [Candidatus Binataceae bacterium]
MPSRRPRPRIAISMGDPAGVGPEVIVKAAGALMRSRRGPQLIVLGDLATKRAAAGRIPGAPTPVKWNDETPELPLPYGLGLRQVGKLSRAAARPGHPSREGGAASFDYVTAGVELVMRGEADALVTGPISKEWWDRAGHHYPGHSELLAEMAGVRRWRMMFGGGTLKVALVTVHLELAKVSRRLT